MARGDSVIHVSIIGDVKQLLGALGEVNTKTGGLLKGLAGGIVAAGVIRKGFDFIGDSLANADKFGDAIETTPLSGRGVVRASVMVYRLDDEDIRTPFVLAEVRLDEGPVVRAVCAGDQVIDGDTLVRATGTARNDQSIEIRFVEENR